MKTVKRAVGVLLVCVVMLPSLGFPLDYTNRSVARLQSTSVSNDCIYFTLVGVSEADPVKIGDPWFAISRSQFGAKDAYAMLLSAKLSGQVVTVRTSGTLACGYASVDAVLMD